MDTFGFTRKKFCSLAPAARHRHVMAWLSKTYQQLVTGRVSPDAFFDFCSRYESLLGWMGEAVPVRPEGNDPRRFIEYVSNAVHFHRQAAGIVGRDENLLPCAQTSDKPQEGSRPVSGRNIILALDGLRSLFNVGSVFRTCDGAGVRTVILGNTPGKEDPRVRKTSMGSHEWIHQETTSDLGQSLLDKKRDGYRIIGVETIKCAAAVHEFAWPSKAVLVFGNEEFGISSHVMAVCDEFIHIPMFGRKNSLNVANAVSVVLFQAVLSTEIRQ